MLSAFLRANVAMVSGSVLAALLTPPHTASAASPAPRNDNTGDDPAAIEEVIVTGTKREEAAQDVPMAVTALSEEQLQREFRNDILAIGEMAPGVTLGQQPGFRALAGGIRGTGQNSILTTQDASVVLLIDEFALSNVQAQFVELFDVERIEVYRGPQGTLFGKSATGGAISITTKRPRINETTAHLETQIGRFVGGDVTDADIFKLRGAVNVPLVEDHLAARVTAIYDTDEGYYRNSKDTATFPEDVPLYNALADSMNRSTESLFPPELDTRTQPDGQHLNATEVFASNVKLLWQPTANYEAYFKWSHLRDNSDTVPGINETPAGGGFLLPLLGFPGIGEAGHDETFETAATMQCPGGNPEALCLQTGQQISVDGFHLHQTFDTNNFTFKLLAGWRNQEEILPNTYVGEAFNSLFDAGRNTTKENLQIEARVSSNLPGPLNFVAGASYTEKETSFQSYGQVGLVGLTAFVDENPNDDVAAPRFDDRGFLNLDLSHLSALGTTGADQDRQTYAVYTDGTYEVTEKLSFKAGVRWTKDKKDFFRRQNPGGPCTELTPSKDRVIVDGQCLDQNSDRISRAGPDFGPEDLEPFEIPLPDSAYAIANEFDDDWSEITWRAVLDYGLSGDTKTYLSYSTGFIPGGFTETCSSLQTCQPYDSETNWNIETGLKGQFFNRTLQTNLAIFYTRYEDLIRSQVLPFTDPFGVTTQETVNVNAGESEAYGAELEVQWVPLPDLDINFNVAYLEHEYRTFRLDRNGDGVEEDLSDLTVPFSPKWKAGGGLTYRQRLGTLGSLAYNTTINYQDSAATSVFNPELTKLEERLLWDANVSWRDTEERYRVSLWAKNLLDEEYRTGANSVAGLWNFTMYGRPRSAGVELAVDF